MLRLDTDLGRELTPAEIAALPQPEPMPLADRKAALRSRAASIRWAKECTGFLWVREGTSESYFIATDEASQSKMGNERKAAEDGIRREGDVWKCGDPVTGLPATPALSDAEIIAMSNAARNRTSDLFNHEAELLAAIDAAGDHAALDLINLEQGWPNA
ncbi:DUF4376 domain-containing protein [Methylorubrum thiocyanatum]|uniref:DUF4376 domain-containing protein n=1 Tax=Methylorubrum thiocyanatum TaxID=47958 RepID=UPI0035C866DF